MDGDAESLEPPAGPDPDRLAAAEADVDRRVAAISMSS
jgi:hypothetical protein